MALRAPLVVLGVAVLARFAITGIEAGATARYATMLVLWCFALGWAAAAAHTTPRRVLVGVLAVASTIGFFGDIQREAIVVLGVVALLWRGTPRLPAPAAVLVRLVASASLWIYLTHWQIYPGLENSGHPVLAIVASLVVGVAAWWLWLVAQWSVRGLAGHAHQVGCVTAPGGYRRGMQVLNGAGQATPTDGTSWVEHLTVPDLSCGTYSIAAGAADPQDPHTEDDCTYALEGRQLSGPRQGRLQ